MTLKTSSVCLSACLSGMGSEIVALLNISVVDKNILYIQSAQNCFGKTEKNVRIIQSTNFSILKISENNSPNIINCTLIGRSGL